jgi:hypothetical protein
MHTRSGADESINLIGVIRLNYISVLSDGCCNEVDLAFYSHYLLIISQKKRNYRLRCVGIEQLMVAI